MMIKYDINKLQKILQNFFNITGINLNFKRVDYVPIPNPRPSNEYCTYIKSCEKGSYMCNLSDYNLIKKSAASKKTEFHQCHAGLTDIVVPILYKNEILGFIIIGQIKTFDNFPEDRLRSLSLDVKKSKELYDNLPFFDEIKLQSVIDVAIILTKYILLENVLKTANISTIDSVTSYIDYNIDHNIRQNLSIKEISKNTNISKSTIYRDFRNHLNCTLNEYINNKKVEKSAAYLETTDMSIEEISEKVGFSSASYYSYIFKKIKNISPNNYKKSFKLQKSSNNNKSAK